MRPSLHLLHRQGHALRSAKREAGFALLLTVTLLAFVVLLVVGLATYTRVETAIAGNTQKQAQARQNALLALDVALGQLQKNAGPDQRVTATAEGFGGVTGTKYFTGVWNNTDATAAPTWLVSGSESGAIDVATTPVAAQRVELVGTKTTGAANDVLAPLVALTTVGVPGVTGTATIGRYAWWVGDQGVKAPVGLGDTSAAVNYAPFGATDLGSRIRQQISLGAGAASFEPRDTANTTLVRNLSATNQLAFLRSSAGSAVGLAALQTNFHAWSSNNFNILADSKSGGLRQDLSLFSASVPSPLGAAYDAWADYASYMEDPIVGAAGAFAPSPVFSADPIRRRYVMQSGPPAIAPVLSYFLLTFNVRTHGGTATVAPLEVRARWMLSLWNPYSAALAPENLRIEVTGLPNIRVDDETPGPGTAFPLQATYGSALKISLPWETSPSSGSPTPDRLSWLPGRVYTWTALEDTTGATPADPGYASKFYSRNLNADAGQGVQRAAPTGFTIDGGHTGHIDGDDTTVTIKLYAVRSGGDVQLATFISPSFTAFRSASHKLSDGSYQFSHLFRLAESVDNPAWLQTAGSDPRQNVLGPAAYVSVPAGPAPEQYENYVTISAPDRLLDRATDAFSYNEDTPVFEMPRAPLLSLGALQHLAIDGAQPFSIGNSWGAATALNSIPSAQLFDRFFYSGLTTAVNPTATGSSLLLPNPLLRVSPRQSDGSATTATDLKNAADARSSKFLLQGGAFNVNSTNAVAWAAVLRSVRFPAPAAFTYLDADASTGTAAATGETTASVQSGDAQFFRFSQSAQETYKAEPGLSASGSSSTPSPPNTHLFRQGMRTLDTNQVATLAAKIAAAIKARQAASGPFRSMEEFLSPLSMGNSSLLEQAVAEAGINASIAEFSSQFLTQADIMTALAPVLFARSDTFVIRSYGEAVNPTTAAVEGRAWCEAVVQRVPDYFDAAADPAETAPAALTSELNKIHGRRFKVVSFRWLTRSDI